MLPCVLAKIIDVSAEYAVTHIVPALLSGFSRVTVKSALLWTLVPNTRMMSSRRPLQGFLLGSVKVWAVERLGSIST